MPSSILTPTQRYAAGALFGLALHQAQIQKTHPLGYASDDGPTADRTSNCSSSSSSDSVSDDPQLWVHDSSGLLRPIFKFLEIDDAAWAGLEETAGHSIAKHHVGAFLRLLAEESGESSSDAAEQELALSKGIDAMASSMEENIDDYKAKKEKQREYANEYREKYSNAQTQPKSEVDNPILLNEQDIGQNPSSTEEVQTKSSKELQERPLEEMTMLGYPRKVIVLYELLSACLAHSLEDKKKFAKRRKGYDARHRAALRLLATWFDVKWNKVVGYCIQLIIANTRLSVYSRTPTP